MFFIPIPKADIDKLESGVSVTINGEPQTLTREDNHLCYEGNRCKIVDVAEGMDNLILPR